MTFSGLYLTTNPLFAIDEHMQPSVTVVSLALIDRLRPSSVPKSIACFCSRLFKTDGRKKGGMRVKRGERAIGKGAERWRENANKKKKNGDCVIGGRMSFSREVASQSISPLTAAVAA